MKYGYRFSNLCGSLYRQGTLIFTPDGNSLLSPVGNRITHIDLINHTSVTLPFENRKHIKCLALSPDATILLSIDIEGHALLVNFQRKVVLSRFHFKAPVRCVKFSPDGRYFAVCHGAKMQVWCTPAPHKEFAPFIMHRTYTGHHDDVVSLDWSPDSKFLLTGSRDMTARLYSLNPIAGFIPITLTGHRDSVIACFFAKSQQVIYTVSRDGALFLWNWQPLSDKEPSGDEESRMAVVPAPAGATPLSAEGRWTLKHKHYFKQNKVLCASLHQLTELLVVGFSDGVFGLYDIQTAAVGGLGGEETGQVATLHTLSISQQQVESAVVNATGEWLAFGCAAQGQLLVWEWQSETYVLKQQGHAQDMNCLAYSPDGQLVATGDDYGKVKLWNMSTGFCFVTFTDHTAPITGIAFSPQGHSVFTSSLDGTVRAFDLIRYRNFRTFQPPQSTQLSCLALDPSGEIVCAGALDSFEIFIWSVQTTRLLDVLGGHEAPVSALAFDPLSSLLASASWDKTVRLWDIFSRKTHTEQLPHNSDVLAVAFRPDGKQLVSASLDGLLHFWEPSSGTHLCTIEGRKDIMGGRSVTDRRTAKTSPADKYFTSVCYSADGECVLAGGNSKYICIYQVAQRLLLKKFQISNNLSLDGVLNFLNSKGMTAGGPMELIDDDPDTDDYTYYEYRTNAALPGVQKGSLALSSQRSTLQKIRTKSVMFSPTGRTWSAITTEGLLVYSLDETLVFDPFQLDIDITPKSIAKTLKAKQYLKALLMSFRLNEQSIISSVFHSIPYDNIQLIVSELPQVHLHRFLAFLGSTMPDSPHVEFFLLWTLHLFNVHGRYLKDHSSTFASVLRSLQKAISSHYEPLSKICEDNTYSLQYVGLMATQRAHSSPIPSSASKRKMPMTESDEDDLP